MLVIRKIEKVLLRLQNVWQFTFIGHRISFVMLTGCQNWF